jgi:hypothetical protein
MGNVFFPLVEFLRFTVPKEDFIGSTCPSVTENFLETYIILVNGCAFSTAPSVSLSLNICETKESSEGYS